MATRRTARHRPHARPPRRVLAEELELKLLHVVKRVEATSYAASTITLALVQQDMSRDREFAICLEKQVSDELDRLVEDCAALLKRYANREYTSLVRHSMLGWRQGLRVRRDR